MKTPPFRFALFLTAGCALLSSCVNYVRTAPTQVPAWKKLVLAQVSLRNGLNDDLRAEAVRYPDLDGLGDAVAAGFTNAFATEAATNLPTPSVFRPASVPRQTPPDPERIWAGADLDWDATPAAERIAWMRSLDADGAVLIRASFSPSLQVLQGELLVADAGGEIRWKQPFRCVSTHILKDGNSPYLSEWEVGLLADKPRPSHEQEIRTVAADLGRQLAVTWGAQWRLRYPGRTAP